MKIAVVGSGISGLACAYYLHRDHEVHVYESEARIGGHTATVDVALGGRRFAVDTGFIVFNDWTYPNFIALLQELGITGKATEMSFSVSDQSTGLEYAGSDLNTLFSQRKNLLSPRFFGMIRDIVRFNKEAVADLERGDIDAGATLGDYLQSRRYGPAFTEQYLVPMGSAIWSSDTDSMLDFPMLFFVKFFKNHGLLSVTNRPQWRVIEGGSREYLTPLTAGFADNIHCNAGIATIERGASGATIVFEDGTRQAFDHVVMACHSDQALALLDQPTLVERDVLEAMPYQSNDVVLHTDIRLLPRSRLAWSSWNYRLTGTDQPAAVPYNMNILQGLDAPETLCVTLNSTAAINPVKILARFSYDHPVFSLSGVRAQERWQEINDSHTWYCGAYWHNGFHEDGVTSARRVAQAILELSSRADQKLGAVA
jgi:predicted NAD/FAD-binding protein